MLHPPVPVHILSSHILGHFIVSAMTGSLPAVEPWNVQLVGKAPRPHVVVNLGPELVLLVTISPEVMRKPATSMTSAAVGIPRIQFSLAALGITLDLLLPARLGGHPREYGKGRREIRSFQITQLLLETRIIPTPL